jgi:hypothetical protein
MIYIIAFLGAILLANVLFWVFCVATWPDNWDVEEGRKSAERAAEEKQ